MDNLEHQRDTRETPVPHHAIVDDTRAKLRGFLEQSETGEVDEAFEKAERGEILQGNTYVPLGEGRMRLVVDKDMHFESALYMLRTNPGKVLVDISEISREIRRRIKAYEATLTVGDAASLTNEHENPGWEEYAHLVEHEDTILAVFDHYSEQIEH